MAFAKIVNAGKGPVCGWFGAIPWYDVANLRVATATGAQFSGGPRKMN